MVAAALKRSASGVTALLIAGGAQAEDGPVHQVEPITVEGQPEVDELTEATVGSIALDESSLARRRSASSDASRLLLDVPGVALAGNGERASLPTIHGLADDRLRIEVDGVELTTACPNHMNAPLSYADSSDIRQVRAFAGLAPVSVGGDAIGGTIQVQSAPPAFASGDQASLVQGQIGSYYRSNGDAFGIHLRASAANRWLSATYRESRSQSNNYTAARGFKPSSAGREGAIPLAANEVGSTATRGAIDRSVRFAARLSRHDLQLNLSQQTVDFEGFPNQRMDMVGNDNRVAALKYRGQFAYGDIIARASYQTTDHAMDMGPDRYSYGTGMPMRTSAKTRSVQLQGNLLVSDNSVMRWGSEYQSYTLFDAWLPVQESGAMGPNTFWNVDHGQRQRVSLFGEWEATWFRHWLTQLGVRSDNITSNTGPVQGYNPDFAGAWAEEATAFNARERQRTDHNWDVTSLLQYAPQTSGAVAVGYSRKSRSPNLYQRYTWSTSPMAALMNNLVGDGNGYVGDVTLRPEVAHTLGVMANWHDPVQNRWEIALASYYTHVTQYIDAKRCESPLCDSAAGSQRGFTILQYANQSAQLYSMDVLAKLLLARTRRWGRLSGVAALNYVRGYNGSTGDGLYHVMPVSGRFMVLHSLGGWSAASELEWAAEKSQVSRVRNEVATPGYWLVNIHGAYQWDTARGAITVSNLLNEFYYLPLGGAYVGQGPTMSSGGVPWGIPVPGRGRSIDVAFDYAF